VAIGYVVATGAQGTSPRLVTVCQSDRCHCYYSLHTLLLGVPLLASILPFQRLSVQAARCIQAALPFRFVFTRSCWLTRPFVDTRPSPSTDSLPFLQVVPGSSAVHRFYLRSAAAPSLQQDSKNMKSLLKAAKSINIPTSIFGEKNIQSCAGHLLSDLVDSCRDLSGKFRL
jgi:hypothetical protein